MFSYLLKLLAFLLVLAGVFLHHHDVACTRDSNSMSNAYKVDDVAHTATGMKITLKATDTNGQSPYGANISPLEVQVTYDTSDRLHVKIFDPNNKRWEIPANLSPVPDPPSASPSSMKYAFKCSNNGEPFYFAVTRKDDNSVLFNSSFGENLQFADQYLSIATSLPKPFYVYGLGEHITPGTLNLQTVTLTMWNYDRGVPDYRNLYGSHPFYLDHRPSGMSHGVYLRNSNGMDVILDQTYSSLTYKVIGGVLDFYFFLGPEPESVIEQYQEVIGHPHMPPYWALGFHQCRYGYHELKDVEEVVDKYKENKIPLDTMWTDIDYMDQFRDFTLDPERFPPADMKTFVDKLHSNGQHYVMITDPGINIDKGYSPYDDGVEMDIFIKDKKGDIFSGRVWPGATAFPDFLHPDGNKYWEKQIAKFHSVVPFDGLWIDMNEASNFCDGECKSTNKEVAQQPRARNGSGFDPNNPPYSINNANTKAPLDSRTIAVDATHYGGVLEYNAHNLFGLSESIATDLALENILNKRSLVISRSTFPGSGRVAGHWTGDIVSTFGDLYRSVADILNFQLYSVPLVGADICGFGGNTNEELCSRWMALGAFYPFSRNHNSKNSASQEPYLWPSVTSISRKALSIRYSLLPYYYTLFYEAHSPQIYDTAPSATVWRPLFFEFPSDLLTYNISSQFMVGRGIMVSPVLDQGDVTVLAYFPGDTVWYDYYTLKMVTNGGKNGRHINLDAPLDHIPIHCRGGSIIPMQQPSLTTTESRMNPFKLLVCLDQIASATGSLFWDDGSSLSMNDYQYIEYSSSKDTLSSTIIKSKKYSGDMPSLTNITIASVLQSPSTVVLNQQKIKTFSYNGDTKVLMVAPVQASMKEPLGLTWY